MSPGGDTKGFQRSVELGDPSPRRSLSPDMWHESYVPWGSLNAACFVEHNGFSRGRVKIKAEHVSTVFRPKGLNRVER